MSKILVGVSIGALFLVLASHGLALDPKPDGSGLNKAAEDSKPHNSQDSSIRTFKGHSGGVASVAFAPDGRTALSGSDDMTLKLWNLDSSD